MKNSLLLILIAGGLGFACACGLLHRSLQQQQDEFARQQAVWQSDKAALEAALTDAQGQVITVVGGTRIVEATNNINPTSASPAEMIARLKTMKVVAEQPRTARLVGHEFENLIGCGPAALPVIRDFLAGNEDVDYDLAAFAKTTRSGRMPTSFNVPPTLRLGLFEALKDIGGAEAEKILADTLTTSSRSLEVAFLTHELEEIMPGKYHDLALQATHNLLGTLTDATANRDDRNLLFATLTFLNDPSFAAQAQAQVIQPDGKVDAAALKYLQQAQPGKALALALQAYQDPRVTDAQSKERLADVALDTAGTDVNADNFFHAVIGDASLPADNRRNLAEDFADHGTNPKNPTAQDIQVMQNRLALLQQIQGETTEPQVITGIMEAQKDLNHYLAAYAAKQQPQ